MNRLFDKSFTLLWLGETAFDIGAALLGFAMGIWVFEKTGSIQQFTWMVIAGALPAVVLMPIAGFWADRYDRRLIILGCDLAAVAIVAVMVLLISFDKLFVEYLYSIAAISAVIGTMRNPSFMAAVSQIVSQSQLAQATSVIQGTAGVIQIGAPMLAGYLIASGGISSIALINLVLAVAGMFGVYAALSSAKHAIHGASNFEKVTFIQGVSESLGGVIRYFCEHRLMQQLLVYILLQESLVVLVSVLVMPMILSHHSSAELGFVMSMGAVGAVVGAIILGVCNPINGLMRLLIFANIGLSSFVILAGVTQTLWLWSLCAFFAFAFAAVSDGCANVLWMRKVPKELRGSLFAAVTAANVLTMLLVLLLGSWLIEHVLEPSMIHGGVLANIAGAYIGVGNGRGVAVMFVLAGLLVATVSMLALIHPYLNKLDELVPNISEGA